MVDLVVDRTGNLDLSFMASLECDLACAHCMYNSTPKTKQRLDYNKTARWCAGIDWNQIHSTGFYGGEPSILLEWYQKFVDLVPPEVPRFVITNGTWSTNPDKTLEFLTWVDKNKMNVVVSGTEWHKPFQDRERLEAISKVMPVEMRLKGEESNLIAMGRGRNLVQNTCTKLCQRWDKPLRIALHPDLEIIFQSCDGEYPRLQGLDEPFSVVQDNIIKLLTTTR